ncbi:TPA: hypothetical protein ACGJ7A_005744 [Pseudomonas aeruginosa]
MSNEQQVTNKKKIKGIEAKHITYCTDQFGKFTDAHFVKERIHFEDGTTANNLRMWENYQRPFWITSKGMRNHKEKKDYEYERNLVKYMSTQIDMKRKISKILGDYSARSLRQLARSPYLYGSDVSSTCYLKHDYQERYPGLISLNTVAGGDIETNVYEAENDGQIICMSVTHKNKAFLAYLKRWVSDIEDPVKETLEQAQKEEVLSHLIKERGLDIEVMVVETPVDIIIECFKRLHTWKPDFFAFWNISFDIGRILKTLEHYGVNPADVFSDPSVPKNYRYFHFKIDEPMTTTASGVTKSKGPEDQWHWITAPSSFQCIDSMSTYRVTRLAKGRDPNYRLESILRKELNIDKSTTIKNDKDLEDFIEGFNKQLVDRPGGVITKYIKNVGSNEWVPVDDFILNDNFTYGDSIRYVMEFGKLTFKETAHLGGIDWHREMQTKHKIKYGLYNIIDSIRLEQLDEQVNDLGRSISLFSKASDYKNFSSNPKRLCDDMHFWYLNRPDPCVIGSSSDQMVHELDQYVIGHNDWIVTLPSYMAGPNGLQCVKDLPNYKTLIFCHIADLDIVSTYPNVSQILNIARETCVMEFSMMEGISEHHRREVGVNLTGGRVNAIEITQKIMGAPKMDTLLEKFINTYKNPK